MSFEFRVPILPNPSFYSNVKLAALSLARLGDGYAAAPIRISVGDKADKDAVLVANDWAQAYPVEWRFIPSHVSDTGFASGLDRFAVSATSDVIILIDADACLMQPIDELLEKLRRADRPTVAGLQAHFPPFDDRSTSEAQWRTLLTGMGFHDVALERRYSMFPPDMGGYCPPYFNYGFVAFNAAAFDRIRPLIPGFTKKFLAQLAGTRQMFFSAQMALTCAILETGVDAVELGPEYNCPNSDEMLAHGLRAAEDVRVMHYLRPDVFDRHTFLCQQEAFEAFRKENFTSSVTQIFQKHVLSLPDVFLDEPILCRASM